MVGVMPTPRVLRRRPFQAPASVSSKSKSSSIHSAWRLRGSAGCWHLALRWLAVAAVLAWLGAGPGDFETAGETRPPANAVCSSVAQMMLTGRRLETPRAIMIASPCERILPQNRAPWITHHTALRLPSLLPDARAHDNAHTIARGCWHRRPR